MTISPDVWSYSHIHSITSSHLPQSQSCHVIRHGKSFELPLSSCFSYVPSLWKRDQGEVRHLTEQQGELFLLASLSFPFIKKEFISLGLTARDSVFLHKKIRKVPTSLKLPPSLNYGGQDVGQVKETWKLSESGSCRRAFLCRKLRKVSTSNRWKGSLERIPLSANRFQGFSQTGLFELLLILQSIHRIYICCFNRLEAYCD